MLEMAARNVVRLPTDKVFLGSDEVVEATLELNRKFLKDEALTPEAVKRLGPPPECPVSDREHLYCTVLVPSNVGCPEFFRRSWEAFSLVHKESWVWPEFWEHQLFDKVQNRPTQLCWAVVELGRASRGRCVEDALSGFLPDGFVPLGPELLLIGAVHAEWAESLNRKGFPYLYAAGLEARFGYSKTAKFAPFLGREPTYNRLALQIEASDSFSSYIGSGFIRYHIG